MLHCYDNHLLLMCECSFCNLMFSFCLALRHGEAPTVLFVVSLLPPPPNTAIDHDANSLLEVGLGGAGGEQ